MSMTRCETHDLPRDTDHEIECPECIRELDEVNAEIERWDRHMYMASMTDNRYHTSGRYAADKAHLCELRDRANALEKSSEMA